MQEMRSVGTLRGKSWQANYVSVEVDFMWQKESCTSCTGSNFHVEVNSCESVNIFPHGEQLHLFWLAGLAGQLIIYQ